MTKESYASLAWAGIGVGAILFFINAVVMETPSAVGTWLAIGLVVLGIWAASRARNFKPKE